MVGLPWFDVQYLLYIYVYCQEVHDEIKKYQIIQSHLLNTNARTKHAVVIHMLSYLAVSRYSLYSMRREDISVIP